MKITGKTLLLLIFSYLFAGHARPSDSGFAPSTLLPVEGEKAMAEFKTFCKLRNCRKQVRISIREDNGREYLLEQELMPPAVQRAFVQVLPGETVSAVPLFEDGNFVGWRESKAEDGPEVPVVQVHLTQDAGKSSMKATIENRSGSHIRIQMYLLTLDHDRVTYTSSCSIGPGNTNYELWPNAFVSLILKQVAVLGPKDSGGCK